jgi:hypothetical protein
MRRPILVRGYRVLEPIARSPGFVHELHRLSKRAAHICVEFSGCAAFAVNECLTRRR